MRALSESRQMSQRGLCQHAARLLSSSSASHSESASFGYKEVPEKDKSGLVNNVFANVASSYDLMNDLMSGGLHRLWKDRLVAKLHPFPGMQHLDVAGGTGDVACRVQNAIDRACQDAAKHPHDPVLEERGEVTVCDLNPEMLEQGKVKPGNERLKWVVGDAQQLPFADNSVDGYTIAFGLRNVTRIPQALQEAHRVLKPGGQFHCLEFSTVNLPVLKELYDAYSFRVIPTLGRVVANDEESYQYLVESIRKFPRQEVLADMMINVNLSCVGYENLSGGIVAIHSAFKA